MLAPLSIGRQQDTATPSTSPNEPRLAGTFDQDISINATNKVPKEFVDQLRNSAKSDLKLGRSARSLVGIGDANITRGAVKPAIRAYKNALIIEPNYWVAKRKLINAYILNGDIDNADRSYSELYDATNKNDDILHEHILFMLAFRDFTTRKPSPPDLEALLRALITRRPTDPMPLISLGVYYLELEANLTSAMRTFKDALQLDSKNIHALNNLGVYHLRQGDLPEARKLFRKAMECDRYYAAAHENLASSYITELKFNSALDVLNNAISRHVPLSILWEHKVGWLYVMLRDWETAIVWHEDRLKQEPNNDFLLNNLGYCYHRTAKTAEARSYYLASISIVKKRLALEGSRGTTRQDPRILNPFTNLGRLCLDMRDIATTEQMYKEILRIDQSHPDAFFLKGAVESMKHSYEASKESLRQAIDLGLTTSLADAYAGLSYIYEEVEQDYKTAIILLREALGRDIDRSIIDNNLAYALIKNGELDEASKILQGTTSQHASLQATTGLLAFARGDFDKGDALYRKAIQLLPPNEKSYAKSKWLYEKAYYQLESGHPAQAKKLLEEIDTKNPITQRHIDQLLESVNEAL